MDNKAKYALGLAVILAVVAFQVFSLMNRDEESAPPTPTEPTSTAQVPAPPTDTATPEPSEEPEGPFTPTETTSEAFDETLLPLVAESMSTWSWEDQHAHTWVERFAPYATRAYADSLRTDYALTSVDEAHWKADVVEPQATSRVASLSSKRIGEGTEEQGYLYYRLDYTIETTYLLPEKAAPALGAKPGAWVKYADVAYEVGFEVEDGQWRVRDVTAVPVPGATNPGDVDESELGDH